jgi:hypothetical protein
MSEPTAVHDNDACVAGACIHGRLHGPCGHELCSGRCEYVGDCSCACHEPGEADSYLAMVKAPIRCQTWIEIARMIKSGEMPHRKVRMRPRGGDD